VQGVLPKDSGKITYKVDNVPAVTDFKVLRRYNGFTLVKVLPTTGRKNQIRIHFKQIGHPLVGESRFSFRKDFRLKAKRALLHASELAFKHPVNGTGISLNSELPQDINNFIQNHGDKT